MLQTDPAAGYRTASSRISLQVACKICVNISPRWMSLFLPIQAPYFRLAGNQLYDWHCHRIGRGGTKKIASFTYKQWLLSIVQNVPRTNKHLRYITTWHDSMSYNHFLYSHRHFWFPAVVQNIWLEEYEEHVVLIICMNNNGYPASKIVTCTGGICISWSEMNCSIMELAFSYTRYIIFMWIVDSLWCHLIAIARQFK